MDRTALTTASSGRARTGSWPTRISGVVMVLGVLLSAAAGWTAWTLDHNNEHHLLEVQTRQAGAVLAATILSIRDPLLTALQIEEATDGNTSRFRDYMAGSTSATGLFVDASLWRVEAGAVTPVAEIGTTPMLAPSSAAAHAFIARALHARTFVVRGIPLGEPRRIGYAIADQRDPLFVVYAERAIPENRVVPVESNPAFANLDYATYIGPLTLSDVATTDVALDQLPLRGDVASDVIAFGDTTLTLVATPRGVLGDALGAALWWIVLLGGLLCTLATALATDQLARRSRAAELNARTISGLYAHLDVLYSQQRSIAETLQRALLPRRNPAIANLEIASRYLAGADGVEIGGDWYSMESIDERHFCFAIGDVSGQGVSAATVMARLRFSLLAYLLEGHPPQRVLEMCARQFDIERDGHFSTVLVGIGDLATRRITLANAGHLRPLLLSATGARYLETPVGAPIGIAAGGYTTTTFDLDRDTTFIAFTDGLVERREEAITDGLDRLAQVAAAASGEALEDLVATLVTALAHDRRDDDLSILAFCWRDRSVGRGGAGTSAQ
jgi:serine phosphatase RsbU (regulator of sigma subunit)